MKEKNYNSLPFFCQNSAIHRDFHCIVKYFTKRNNAKEKNDNSVLHLVNVSHSASNTNCDGILKLSLMEFLQLVLSLHI